MKQKISIVGGGSCALMLACELNPSKFEVSVYERNSKPARKFLVAGDGGLNITHTEKKENFIERYTPFEFLKPAFYHFSNNDLVKWFSDLGIKTFVGTSGRVFPEKEIKPVDVLNAILKKIENNSVKIYDKYVWKGFAENGSLIFEHNKNETEVKGHLVIFCLGGASWPVTGSMGEWRSYFEGQKIKTIPFRASNCAFKINWPSDLIKMIEGKVLKNVSISCGSRTHLGEVVLTQFGIEGSGIYPLSPQIREGLAGNGTAVITLDLKHPFSEKQIIEKLKSNKKNLTDCLKSELNFDQTQIRLLKTFISKEDFLNIEKLAGLIKNFKLTVTGTAPVEEAISTTGGVALNEIDLHFELKKLPGHFVIGEMLDYDAPTGGYLLQSCFSMAKYLADHLNNTF